MFKVKTDSINPFTGEPESFEFLFKTKKAAIKFYKKKTSAADSEVYELSQIGSILCQKKIRKKKTTSTRSLKALRGIYAADPAQEARIEDTQAKLDALELMKSTEKKEERVQEVGSNVLRGEVPAHSRYKSWASRKILLEQ